MFFLLMCVGLWALIATKTPTDTYGWLMLVATGWFLGFLDGQLASRNKSNTTPTPNPDSTMPPAEDAFVH